MRQPRPLMTFLAFTDESSTSGERYQSIAALSLPRDRHRQLDDAVASVLARAGVKEFKWHDLTGVKRGQCATDLIDVVLDGCDYAGVRVDIVIWDTQDTRHRVTQRDDNRNLERMFFHLLRLSMSKRPSADWHIHPDERSGTDWITLQQCLASVGSWRRRFDATLLANAYEEYLWRVKTLSPIVSATTPLCQVADLFAGMAAYSRRAMKRYREWERANSAQTDIFDSDPTGAETHRDRARFPVLRHLSEECRARKLGVSLRTHGFLLTRDPNKPINFWHYTPQHPADKAPTKMR